MINVFTEIDGVSVALRDDIQMKSGETGVFGEALTITSAGLTKSATTARPDGIYVGKVESSVARRDVYRPVRNDDTFVIDVVGDMTGVTPGITTFCLTADGLNLDAATATGGKITVLRVLDKIKKKVIIKFN